VCPPVADRVAQPVAAQALERKDKPTFHPTPTATGPADPRSTQPGHAGGGVGEPMASWTRTISNFFDAVDHQPWSGRLRRTPAGAWWCYLRRWLVALLQRLDHPGGQGPGPHRTVFTGAGESVLHYAVDAWMN
jgi:hypothetical protein